MIVCATRKRKNCCCWCLIALTIKLCLIPFYFYSFNHQTPPTTPPPLNHTTAAPTTYIDDSIYKTYREKIFTSNLSPENIKLELSTEPLYHVSAKCSGPVYLLVMVISSPENWDRRTFIRSSWAHAYDKHIKLIPSPQPFQDEQNYTMENIFKVVFLVGRPRDKITWSALLLESEYEGDIVFGNFTDDYTNLTRKTRTGLKWSNYACASRFVMKTDDDVYVNGVWLVEWLKGVKPMKLYTGKCDKAVYVIRDKDSKWFVPYQEYRERRYPHYCMGPGYIISRDVLNRMIDISYGRPLFRMEDVYVGLLVRDLAWFDVKVRDERWHFRSYGFAEPKQLCDLNQMFTGHQVIGFDTVALTNRMTKALYRCHMWYT